MRTTGDVMSEGEAADAVKELEAVERVRARAGPGRGALSTYGIGGAFAAFAIALPLVRGVDASATDLAVLAALTIAYAFAFGVQFEVGPGSAVPTQLAFVPMLVFGPPTLVPLAVGVAILARAGWDPDACTCPARQRPWALLAGGWYALGAVAVVLWAGPGTPGWAVIAAATALQIVIDGAISFIRVHFALGFPGRALAGTLAWTYVADAALTPVAFAVAIGADGAGAFITAAAIAGLLAFLSLVAADRRRHLQRTRRVTDAYREAAARARRDPLTGLANRLAWEEAVEAAAFIGREHLGVVVVDVDGLKHANDTRGHAVGDALLGAVADVLEHCAARAELVARLGGDEFGILVVDEHVAELDHLVAAIRRRLAEHPGVDGVPLGASLGSAAMPPAGSVQEALAEADASLYREKAARPGSRDGLLTR